MSEVVLSEIAAQIRGVSYGKADVADRPTPGYLPVLRANNITDNGLSLDDLVYVKESCITEKQKIKAGDIVVAASSGSISVVGKAAQAEADIDAGFGAFCKVVRPSERVNARYLGHFFRTPEYRQKMSTLAAGANINNLKNEHIDELIIPLPPLDEQERIASILDQADQLRRKRQRGIERLNKLGQAIFSEMFSSRNDLTLAKIKEVAKVSTGSTPPTSDENSFNGPVPFVTPGDLNSNQSVKRSLSEQGAKRSRTVHAGATLVCCIGATIGKIDRAKEFSAFNQQINAIEWGSIIDPVYGYYATQLLRPTIIHKGKGASTTLPILKKSEFEKLEITYPNKELQTLFSSRIAEVEATQSLVNDRSSRLEKLFVALQARAFKGEL